MTCWDTPSCLAVDNELHQVKLISRSLDLLLVVVVAWKLVALYKESEFGCRLASGATLSVLRLDCLHVAETAPPHVGGKYVRCEDQRYRAVPSH